MAKKEQAVVRKDISRFRWTLSEIKKHKVAYLMVAPFFILFYGIMMADMGYGLIMIAAAVVAMIKMKPRAGTLSFCQLLLWGGISTFAMGALTGGFFGDALEQVGKIIGIHNVSSGL